VRQDSPPCLLWPWPVSEEGGDETSEVAVTDETVKEESAGPQQVKLCRAQTCLRVHEGYALLCSVPVCRILRPAMASLSGPGSWSGAEREPSGSRGAEVSVCVLGAFLGMAPRLPSPSWPSASVALQVKCGPAQLSSGCRSISATGWELSKNHESRAGTLKVSRDSQVGRREEETESLKLLECKNSSILDPRTLQLFSPPWRSVAARLRGPWRSRSPRV